jgi:hypothetical protein
MSNQEFILGADKLLRSDCCDDATCSNYLHTLEDAGNKCHEKFRDKHSNVSWDGKIRGDTDTLCGRLDTRRKYISKKRNVLAELEKTGSNHSATPLHVTRLRKSLGGGRKRGGRHTKKKYSRRGSRVKK